ncbi:alpha/beta hydrolase [Hirschia litorea]|uniref:Alpha/beta hydrolase n=1 Tax=Hirschia litorea TaxID=1199156 RepID=A0ABW2IJQ0_9PROT
MRTRSSWKKRFVVATGLVLSAGMLLMSSSCAVQLGLKRADTDLTGPPFAEPAILSAMNEQGQITQVSQWPERREFLKQQLSEYVYGPYPSGVKAHQIGHKLIDENYANGAGRLEEYTIQIGENGPRFHVGLVLPQSAGVETPAPLIVAQSFCQNSAALHHDGLTAPEAGGVCGGGGIMASIIKLIFGEYIEGPPIEAVLKRGYAYATIYSSEIAADNAETAHIGIEKIASQTSPENAPVGVISAWAAGYGWALDVLDQDMRMDTARTAAWGHSRQGKAALWGAAHDDRIEAIIAHQSGTGGATLTKSLNGESVKKITEEYPHWFNDAYASYSKRESDIPIDQHALIALVAPRPVLLGNSWNDVWSDPNGAFRAAQGADPAYKLLGVKGLAQSGMKDADITKGELAFQISKGHHGIREYDWEDFLTFLDAWFFPNES